MSKSVCVIGAGACGLIAAKVFAEHGLLPAVFEQSADIGGQWRYDPSVTAASTSAMYEQLLTNLPSDVMQLSDFPFPPGTAAFPHHSVVLRYLHDYAEHWRLRPLIAFNVKVELVDKRTTGGFDVTLSSSSPLPDVDGCSSSLYEELPSPHSFCPSLRVYRRHFDAVCVCNGHFSRPFYPAVLGLMPPAEPAELLSQLIARAASPALRSSRPPIVLHSLHYRSPLPFTGLRVLIVGSGHSGTDIAGEICATARSVHLSRRGGVEQEHTHAAVLHRLQLAGKQLCTSFPSFHYCGPLFAVSSSSPAVTLLEPADAGRQQQQTLDVDVVLCATGFHYSFPFLAPPSRLQLSTDELHVSGLYAHLLYPTADAEAGVVVCPALQWSIVPFPLCEVQCEWAARVVQGACRLSSAEEQQRWLRDEERRQAALGLKGRYLARCDSMVQSVRWMLQMMRRGGEDELFDYEFTIDEERRVRRRTRSVRAADMLQR